MKCTQVRGAAHLVLRDSEDQNTLLMECAHCGLVEAITMPMRDDLFVSIARAFLGRHLDCPTPLGKASGAA